MKVVRGIRRVFLPNGRRKFVKDTLTLKRKYGFFRCRCPRGSSWESSHVYCIEDTKKVYFRQKCRKCGEARNPYLVEKLKCPDCRRTVCTCTKRHIDMKKVHREDLCMKCEGGYPCVDHHSRSTRF